MKTESIFLTATIEAHKGQDVATVNLPEAFCHTNVDLLDKTMFMVLRGELTILMDHENPELYRKYINTGRKGKKIVYSCLQKVN